MHDGERQMPDATGIAGRLDATGTAGRLDATGTAGRIDATGIAGRLGEWIGSRGSFRPGPCEDAVPGRPAAQLDPATMRPRCERLGNSMWRGLTKPSGSD